MHSRSENPQPRPAANAPCQASPQPQVSLTAIGIAGTWKRLRVAGVHLPRPVRAGGHGGVDVRVDVQDVAEHVAGTVRSGEFPRVIDRVDGVGDSREQILQARIVVHEIADETPAVAVDDRRDLQRFVHVMPVELRDPDGVQERARREGRVFRREVVEGDDRALAVGTPDQDRRGAGRPFRVGMQVFDMDAVADEGVPDEASVGVVSDRAQVPRFRADSRRRDRRVGRHPAALLEVSVRAGSGRRARGIRRPETSGPAC